MAENVVSALIEVLLLSRRGKVGPGKKEAAEQPSVDRA